VVMRRAGPRVKAVPPPAPWYLFGVSEAAAKPVGGRLAPEPVRVGAAGMWAFLATDAMGFAGLFIAYGVLRVRADAWPEPGPHLALRPAAAMTFALLVSSLTMALASGAASRRARLTWLFLTVALGSAFLAAAGVEYADLAAAGLGFSSSLPVSMFYALTGYHALHVLAGIVMLVFMLGGRVSRRTLKVASLYWHFVDLAWMPIFTFVYLLPPS
jgi:heme/copper-type cytochrome/quinol oxidase subunit 3